MGVSGTDFLLKIQSQLTGNAASELAKVESGLKSGLASYRAYEKASASAAAGLEKVANEIAGVRAKMASAMNANDEKGFWKAAAGLQKLTDKQAGLKTKAADAAAGMTRQQTALTGLSARFDELGASQTQVSAGGSEVGKAMKKLGGPLGKVGDFADDSSEAWAKLTGELGTAGAVGAVAAVGLAVVAAAVLALAAVAVVGLAKFTAFAVGLANSSRNASLTTEAMSKSGAQFAAFGSAIDETSRATGLGSDRLQAIVGDLRAAGIAAADIPAALRGIATQEAALGDSSGTAALIDKLKNGTIAAGTLARTMDQKLGGVVEKRMLSLEGISASWNRNLSSLFSGINVEPLFEGFAKIVGLLDTSTTSGAALKALVEAMFAPLASSGPLFVQVERFFLGMEIAALKIAIAVKGIAKQFDGVNLGPLKDLVDAGDLGQVAMVALVVVVGLLTLALASMAIAALAATLPFVALGVVLGLLLLPVAAVGLALYGIYSAANDLAALDWASIGNDIVDGLLGPIRDPGAVVKAFTDFGKTAASTLKDTLGIASPSKVFASLGGYSAEGYAVGLEEGSPRVESALAGMTSAPVAALTKATGAGLSLTIGDVSIVGVEDAEDVVDRLLERIVDELDGVALRGGAT